MPLACGYSIDLLNRSVTVKGEMAVMWQPLSQAIVFGLSFATVLTLVATPAMLAAPAAIREFAARFRRESVAEEQRGQVQGG